MEVKGDKLYVRIEDAGQGLVVKGNEIKGAVI